MVFLSLLVPAAHAGVPDVSRSYFVPQSGSVATPTEGPAAIARARRCPNDEGPQGLLGWGDDSIIAKFQYNELANCPDVRCVQADAPTDASGVTYITWIGSTPGQPGIGTRDPFRKWGGYAGDIPVMVLGFKLQGKLTSASPLGTYTAHVKSVDCVGGRLHNFNQGELVNTLDVNLVQAAIGTPYKYYLDFDNNGIVNTIDLNFIKGHNSHRCNLPVVN